MFVFMSLQNCCQIANILKLSNVLDIADVLERELL